MPRKSGAKQKSADGRSRNIPALLKEMDARLTELENGIADDVQESATDAVPELVRTELRGIIVRWAEDLGPK